MKVIILTIPLLFLLSSCSSYINSWHKQLDKETGRTTRKSPKYNKFNLYRKYGRRNNLQNPISTNSRKHVAPNVKRSYRPKEAVKKRFKANDLNDNGSSGSLWSGKGKDSYLFTSDSRKRYGDIILINVFTRLKNDITAELKRAFPEPPKKKKVAKTDKKGKKGKAKKKPAPKIANNQQQQQGSGAHDKISSVIIEEINKDHLLLSGRKSILYKNRKHLIELQALVARRDVSVNDEVDSKQIIEHSISVLK